MLRVLLLLLCAAAAWSAAAPAAQAHALPASSSPAPGSTLTQLPKAVTITFDEAVVVRLSSITVDDAAGHVVSLGQARAVPGGGPELTVGLPTLLGGVYTVHWRTVSSDDGHVASGSFTFGVGPLAYAAMSGPAPELLSAPSSATPGSVTGTWLFDVGLGLLVGGCWVAVYGFPEGGRRLLILALGGVGVLLAGLAVTGWAESRTDQIGLGELASTSLGLGLLTQAAPSIAAGVCAAIGLRRRNPSRLRRPLLLAALTLAAVATAAHVLTTHAASGTNAGWELIEQWTHVASFATWIGGLAALILAVGTEPGPQKTAAIKRFSKLAGYSLAVLCLSGALRAWDEVGAWHALADTLFGRLVLVKIGLLAVLAGFGAYHRLRTVPQAGQSLRKLRSLGKGELAVAGVTLLAAAILSSTLPPSLVQNAARAPVAPHVLAYGVAPGLRASLEVSPDYPGANEFTLRVYDAGSGAAMPRSELSGVHLAFFSASGLSADDGGETRAPVASLALNPSSAGDGSFTAAGSQLSLTGSWIVQAELGLPGGGADIPFTVTCSPSPAQLEEMTMGRMTMIYGLQLEQGRQLEAYLTPGKPGRDTLHLVFTDQHDGPVTLEAPPAVTVHQEGSTVSRTLTMQTIGASPLTRDDYFAPAQYTAGRWDFQMSARDSHGVLLTADFTLTVS